MNLAKMAKEAVRKGKVAVQAHTPEMLLVLGTGAFAATVVMAVQASPAAGRKMEKARYECLSIQGKGRKILHIAKEVTPVYLPTALMGAASLACFFGAHRIHVKRQVALASAYSMMSQTLNTYQDKIIEKFGEDAHLDILDKVLAEDDPDDESWEETDSFEGDGDTLVYDRVTGRYFKSTPAKIREAESAIVKRTMDEMTVTLNQFYEELGLADCSFVGEAIGWDAERARLDIAFRSTLDESDRPCLVLVYRTTVIDSGALRVP